MGKLISLIVPCILYLMYEAVMIIKSCLATTLMINFVYRIRTEIQGGAWCPKQIITKESYEYLQVDLGELTVITKVEVQGRFGNGQVSDVFVH